MPFEDFYSIEKLKLFTNKPSSLCNVSWLGFFAFHCFGANTFDIRGSSCIVSPQSLLTSYLSGSNAYNAFLSRPPWFHFSWICSSEWMGTFVTMSAPTSSQLQLSPVACPGNSTSPTLARYKSSPDPRSRFSRTRPSFTAHHDFDDFHDQQIRE